MLLACDELETYLATQNLASQTAEGQEMLCEVGSGLEPTSLPPLPNETHFLVVARDSIHL